MLRKPLTRPQALRNVLLVKISATRLPGRTLVKHAALAVAALLTVTACATGGAAAGSSDDNTSDNAEAAITITHQQGTASFAHSPTTVVALDWGVITVLDALGVEVAGAPMASAHVMPDYLAGAMADAVNVGTLHEPDFEAIAALNPDVIIAAARSQVHVAELSRIAPTVDFTIDGTDVVAQSIAQARELGTLFDRQDQAESLIGTLEESFDQLGLVGAEAGDALMILTTGGNVSAHGEQGRFSILYHELGFEPAATLDLPTGQEPRHGMAVSFEFILDVDPDWLFVIDRDSAIGAQGAVMAQSVLDNSIIRATSAYQNNRIVYVDTMNWYILGGGVVALQGIADEMAAVFAADGSQS